MLHTNTYLCTVLIIIKTERIRKMWALFGVVFAVFLQHVSYGAQPYNKLIYPHKIFCKGSLLLDTYTWNFHLNWPDIFQWNKYDNTLATWYTPRVRATLERWWCKTNKDCIYLKIEESMLALKNYIPNLPTTESDQTIAYFFFRSAWIFDYPEIECPPILITPKHRVPIPQLQYVAKLSNLFLSQVSYHRKEVCELVQSIGRIPTKAIRDRVSKVCEKNEHADLCKLNPFFELTNIFEDILCNTTKFDEASWNINSKHFNLYRNCLTLLFYSFKREVPSDFTSLIDFSVVSEQKVKDSIHYIIQELNEKVKNDDVMLHSVLKTILSIVPSKSRLVEDGIADYPSFNWIVSYGVNALQQVQSFVVRYGVGKAQNILKQKSLDTQIDYRQYIQTLKTTQIKEMTDSIPSNIQALGNGIGTYFYQVASYEKRKKTADISYLQSTINKYKQAFHEATSKLKDTMVDVVDIYITGASTELVEDTAKLVTLCAAAGNPLKWIAGGDAGDIIDSAVAVAEASRKLADAFRNIEEYHSLIEFNIQISKKLSKNEGPLKAVRTLLNEIENNSTSKGFSKLQDKFISQYSDYTPAIRKDELKELTVQWENLIDAICTGVENTDGIAANAARGVGDTNGKCLKAKRSAAMLTVCLEEIYDFQFELMETMASLMHSLVQIESSKALGSSSQDTLSTKDFQTIAAIIGISYKLTQANNVEMLCNIMEYQNAGKTPSECTGLSTDIDRLTSIERPTYNIEKHYVKVPSQRNIPVNDALVWFDLRKLYAGETILFQIPNSTWLVNNGWISPHLKDKAIYVKEFSVILPVVSQSGPRQIEVAVAPSFVGNKLHDYSTTYYSISHSRTMAHSYIEGHRQQSCWIQPTIYNPYKMNACGQDSDYPRLCQTSLGTTTQIKEQLYPSIYSEFIIKVYGYEDAQLGVPATKLGVQIGLTYYYLSEHNLNKVQQSNRRTLSAKQVDSSCCPQNNYFNSDNYQCQACPRGTRSFYDGLFCGDLIEMVEANLTKTPKNETFTYTMAVARCKEAGSIGIANSTIIKEAVGLKAKSCTCGWIYGEKVVSIGARSGCKDTAACSTANNIRHAYCATRYKP